MKPRLLFLSPFVPAPGGHGSCMRAYRFIEALAPHFEIHALLAGHAESLRLPPEWCRQIAFTPLTLWPDPHARIKSLLAFLPPLYRQLWPSPFEWQRAAACRFDYPFDETNFDVVHVFRFYMTPLMDKLLRQVRAGKLWLDLDDIERSVRSQLAELRARQGCAARAAWARLEAAQYAGLEATHLRRFARVFVASPEDRKRLIDTGLHGAPEWVPNVVSVPAARGSPPAGRERFRFLFVGTLNYEPNVDGLRWFCAEVLPRLRRLCPVPFVVRVVGRGLSKSLYRRFAAHPELELAGYAPDIELEYREASAVLVPVWAGGGSSIKTLEAFAFGRPVVATPVGVRGLGVEPGRHFLPADTPAAFADACALLMSRPDLGRSLAAAAYDYVRAHHSPNALERALRPA